MKFFLSFFIIHFICFSIIFISPKEVFAACTGANSCCQAYQTVNTPPGCSSSCAKVCSLDNFRTCTTDAQCATAYAGTCVNTPGCTVCTGTSTTCITSIAPGCVYNPPQSTTCVGATTLLGAGSACQGNIVNTCTYTPDCSCGAWGACSAVACGTTGTQTRSCSGVNCAGFATSRSCSAPACSPPVCGANGCEIGESCGSCPVDCGACVGEYCGNGSCGGGESCASCPNDCGSCAPSQVCGNGSCGGGETCSNCAADCGSCAETCGNGLCRSGETCGSCPADCACTCGNGVCAGTETCTSCPGDCGPCGGAITGQIYLDTSNTASIVAGRCTGPGTLQNPGSGSTVVATWGSAPVKNTGGSITGSSYSIAGVGYDPNTIVTLSPDTSQYTCVCPAGCAYSGLSAPTTGLNYYITNAQEAWWQLRGGLAYAGGTTGTTLRSYVPPGCTSPTCGDSVAARLPSDLTGSSGYLITGGGGIDTTQAADTLYAKARQDSPFDQRVQNLTLNGPKEDYGFFARLLGMSSTTAIDFTGAQPAGSPVNGRAFYASQPITISTPWAVPANQKLIILINNSLRIDAPITVAPGGFLAFVTSGNITIGNTVGNSTLTDATPVVEGMYITDSQLIIEGGLAGGDKRFVGAGSFIAWSGIQLPRQFANKTNNNTIPTDLFIYRPDLMANTPESLKRPIQIWQETN